MAFGVVQSENVKSNEDRHVQSAKFFDMAWKLLPQLMEQADLWALKATGSQSYDANGKSCSCYTVFD